MILVTGAAGKTGQAIISQLVKSGEEIRALVHREDQVPLVENLGVQEVIVGDMLKQKTRDQALDGIRAVYHIPPSANQQEAAIGEAMIDAAVNSGVEHFVFHSVLHPQLAGLTHHHQKLLVEEKLIQSGLPFTILQPASYMQNILGSWDQLMQGIYPSMYDLSTRVDLVDLDDVGEVAAIVLREKSHFSASYELCSGANLSVSEIIAFWSSHLGTPVEGRVVPMSAWEDGARNSGLEPARVATLSRMFQYYGTYGFPGNSSVLGWILHRNPTSYEEFIEKTLQKNATQ
ncbi:MAG TPA: NmrA family NAD(P)-binding protein [Candidatus Lokiarchaeia archaeon]|nr:NmrA family NAD(P)-binding protein [Candidatus Lokiarchaeia archaeon]